MDFGDLGTLLSNFGLKMVSWRPRRYLKTFLEPVASFSLSMASSTLTATPIVPENMFAKMLNMCENVRKPRNLTHNQSNWSIHLKNPTNAHPKVSVFDIRLPYWTIFWDLIFQKYKIYCSKVEDVNCSNIEDLFFENMMVYFRKYKSLFFGNTIVVKEC